MTTKKPQHFDYQIYYSYNPTKCRQHWLNKKQPTADDLVKFDAVQRKADWLAKVLTASNKLDKYKKGGKR